MTKLPIELVRAHNEKFDGRSYWSQTATIAGLPMSVRWVAEGEKQMDATKFFLHAERIFNRMEQYVKS